MDSRSLRKINQAKSLWSRQTKLASITRKRERVELRSSIHLLRSTKENAFIVRSDFENFGPFIDTDLAPPKNSSGAKLFRENDVIFIGHVLNLVLRLSLLCLLNEVAMCFVSTRSSVSICLASWCASLFSLTFSSRLVYFLVEFWTLLPCLFYMFTITIA